MGEEAGDFLLPLDGAVETIKDVGLHVEDVVAELTGAGMSNVLFVVDGCRTGSENTFGRELWELAERSRLAIVLGCEPGEQSFEDARLGGGVFTSQLVEALEDPTLVDEASGALWASRVAARAREQVMSWTSRGFDGQQVPQVWTDPTRDVLLAAELPDEAATVVSSFQDAARELDLQRYLAAAGRYAEMLYAAERHAEGAELLKACEQMGELPPHLLYLMADCLQRGGRNAEMARVLQQLREKHPESLYTLTAIAHDLSGETSAAVRYRASKQLWDGWLIDSPDLALLIAMNMINGGPQSEARVVLETMLPHFDPATRTGAYAGFMAHVLDGRMEDALGLLERAEEFAGDYPGIWRLRYERFRLLEQQGRNEEVRALLDRCVEEDPDDGTWHAQRALSRYEAEDWDGAKADAARALEVPLAPWTLLLAVRALGLRAEELRETVARQAERHPLSWQASLALALMINDSVAAQQEAFDAARRLAPELGPWTATVATIRYERAREALVRELVDGQFFSNQRYELLSVLADRAGTLGGEGEGWGLLCKLAQACSRQRQNVALIDLHFGPAIDAGEVPGLLVIPFSIAFLNCGRLESFRRVAAQATAGSGLATDLGWIEAAWLACAGREDEARARLAGLPPARPLMASVPPYLLADLAARAGENERATVLLADAPGVDGFRGTVELEVIAGEGELEATGATLLLTVRKEGKVNGTLERADGDVWSLTGTIDAFGNLEAALKGAPSPARVYAKLAPPAAYKEDPLLREHGLLLQLLDEKARVSVWVVRASP